MTRQRVLTDEQWAVVVPHLPARTRENWVGRGRAWGDHRRAVEGIIWRFRTGSPWRDLPAEYGPWQTVYRRFNTWSKDGTFNRVLAAVQGQAQRAGELEWVVSVDSSNARAHKHAAGARKPLSEQPGEPPSEPSGEGSGPVTGGLFELQEVCRGAR